MINSILHFGRHYMHLTYHALHHFGVPRKLIPDTFLVLVAILVTVWLVLHVLVGRQAQRKGQSFWYGFLFALISTPFVASLYVAFLRPLKMARATSRKRSSFANGRGRDRERVA